MLGWTEIELRDPLVTQSSSKEAFIITGICVEDWYITDSAGKNIDRSHGPGGWYTFQAGVSSRRVQLES